MPPRPTEGCRGVTSLYALENMRYRSGTMAGYASRLHYITDWALDNSHRGNLREITSSMPKAVYTEKNLDFMSTHADAYPQLADSAQLAGIKAIERNFRPIRIYYIKSADVDTPGSAECPAKRRHCSTVHQNKKVST